VAFRYDELGNRLKAFRLGSGMSAEEIAQRIEISRSAFYRIEKGELVKIETLEKLSDLLNVSMPTLLGVGIEYIGSAVSYFERVRQLEEEAEHIVVLAGPISVLLASEPFVQKLEDVLSESIPSDVQDRARLLSDVKRIVTLMGERREMYRKRQPTIVNLISALEIERLLESGYIGRSGLSKEIGRQRRSLAREEVAHFASIMENEPLGVQIGLVTDIVPHAGFQIFRQSNRQVLSISPFRLGEHPNVRVGMAMITSAPEALALHHRTVQELWRRSLKGPSAVRYFKELLVRQEIRAAPL
jgi:transcriptional regulator with XRE-family HTH domain